MTSVKVETRTAPVRLDKGQKVVVVAIFIIVVERQGINGAKKEVRGCSRHWRE